MDRDTGHSFEAIVDLRAAAIRSYEPVPAGLQPSIMLDEFVECEKAVKRSPEFLAALGKRGVTDPDLVMVEPWSAGIYGTEVAEDKGRRLLRALCFVRSEPTDNGYARPLDGVVVVVDLNKMEVLRVEDYGVVPLPPEAGNWAGEYVPQVRGPTSSRWRSSSPTGRASRSTATRSAGRTGASASASRRARGWCCTPSRYDDGGKRAADPVPRLGLRDGRPLRRPGRAVLTARTPSTSASTASARWPTRWRWAATASAPIRYFDAHHARQPGQGRHASRTPSACTRRTPASSGSTPTGGRTSPRCGARGGCRCRSSPPSATTSTASSGTSTRTARSSAR